VLHVRSSLPALQQQESLAKSTTTSELPDRTVKELASVDLDTVAYKAYPETASGSGTVFSFTSLNA
jgi:hypothetical protein